MLDSIEALTAIWREQKAVELAAQAKRREVEDRIATLLAKAPNFSGTVNAGDLKVSYSLTEKIDVDQLQTLARKHGMVDALSECFRWKPEIKRKEWNDADEKVRAALSGAITRSPARPSFQIRESETK